MECSSCKFNSSQFDDVFFTIGLRKNFLYRETLVNFSLPRKGMEENLCTWHYELYAYCVMYKLDTSSGNSREDARPVVVSFSLYVTRFT